ncbi:hypothetical protein MMC31_002907 [Peltigera leucophlebia]|nr:hypothetical protein [Peltigera leucophlebia]
MRHGECNAREAGERERQQQQRYEEERTGALEKQRTEDKLWARLEEQERRAAGKIKGNALDAEAQWQSQMNELYAREAAVPQSGMWAHGTPPVGNMGIQQREVRYNGPGKGQKALEVLPF